jgi:hypothetical protein
MHTVKTKILLLLTLLSIFLLNGCSSHKEVVSVSEAHLYDTNFGLHSSSDMDERLEEELVAVNIPTETDVSQVSNPEWTTELTKDPDAFLAEDYVQPEPIITYKYKFDKKFYDKPEWRTAEF